MKNIPDLPPLKDGRIYNYILLFDSGNLKIGISTDVKQRIKQLSNSNSGGFKLINYNITPPNYIASTLEKYLHYIFREYKVEGEFFKDLDFNEVCKKCDEIMHSDEFVRCNEIRKDFIKTAYDSHSFDILSENNHDKEEHK